MFTQESLSERLLSLRSAAASASGTTRSGLQYVNINTPKVSINDKKFHKIACETALEALGQHAWKYATNDGHTCRRLASVFVNQVKPKVGYDKLTYSTFYKWFQHYLQHGETAPERRERERNRRSRRKASYYKKFNKARTFDPQDDVALLSIVDDNPQLYLDEICTLMTRRRRKKWSPSAIWKRLHGLGYSLQACVQKARQRDELKRQQCKHRLKMLVRNPEQLMYVDETHKSANASRRRRGWSKRGVQPTVDAYFEENFRKKYTMIGACDINGFVASACQLVERETSSNDTDPERGTVDNEKFERYVNQCLVPNLGRYDLAEPRSIVVMDNASIHISDGVVEAIESAGAVILYSAPYSPDLNPIEYMFSIYKAGLKRHTWTQGVNWKEAHYRSLKDVTPVKAENYFRKCGVPGVSAKLSNQGNNTRAVILLTHLLQQYQTMQVVATYYHKNKLNSS